MQNAFKPCFCLQLSGFQVISGFQVESPEFNSGPGPFQVEVNITAALAILFRVSFPSSLGGFVSLRQVVQSPSLTLILDVVP